MLALWRSRPFWPSLLWPGFRPRIKPWPVIPWTLVTIRTTPLTHRARTLLYLPVRLPVSRCRTDFELVQFIPLLIGTIPVRDGKKFTYPSTRIKWLWIIHNRIMNYTAVLIQHSLQIVYAKLRKTIHQTAYSAL
jgi:hypothetical protein